MVSPTFNFSGIASGLDTNSIVSQLMQIERAPITRLQVQRAEYEDRRDAWTSITTKLSEFRTALDSARYASDFDAFTTVTSTNEDAVSISASGSPAATTLDVTVEQLAATHQLATGSGFGASTALVGTGSFEIDVDGTVTTIDTDDTTTLQDLASQITSDVDGVNATVVQVAEGDHRLLLTAENSGAANTFTATSNLVGLATTDTIVTGADASIRLGAPINGLQITRSSNVFTDVVEGVTFTANQTTTSPVTLTIGRDPEAAAEAVAGVFNSANDLLAEIERHTAFDSASETASALTGDSSARDMVLSLRSALSEIVPNGGQYRTISEIGVEFDRDGTYTVDMDALTAALEADYDSVVSMFGSSTTDGGQYVSIVSTGNNSTSGFYDVVVDTAATEPLVIGGEYQPSNQVEDLNIQFGGVNTLITISNGSTVEQAVDAINNGLQANGVTALLASATQITDPGNGNGNGNGNGGGLVDAIQITAPGQYGSAHEIAIWNDQAFNLNAVATGTDVAGTIGGEAATGVGQTLTGTAGDTDGMVLTVTVTADQVGNGGFLAGSIGTTAGLSNRLDDWLDRFEGVDGEIARAKGEWEARIDDIDDSVAAFETRMSLRETQLRREFTAMEQALAQLQAQGSFITSLLPAAPTTGTT